MFAAVRVAGITDSLLLRGKPGVPLPLWIPTLAWAIPIVSAIVALDYIFGGPLAAARLARPGSGQAVETRVMILGVLGRYFALSFTKTVLAVFGGVFVLIFTIDTVETLRRSGDTPRATAALVAWLAFLHTPIVAEQVMPFAALLGSMIAFLNLSRRLELVVARAAGVSVWQFLSPALIVAVALGVVEISVYNPLSTWMKRQSESLEAQLIGGPANSGIGSWFSQQSVDGLTIVHAERAGDNVFAHFQAFNFDPDGKFSQRVDAERATLRDGYWELRNTTVVAPGFDTQTAGVFLLATNLSARDVSQAFTAPDTVSFWRLSALADQMERAGFDGGPYRLRFQQLLAMPAMLVAMVLLASCFSLRLFRMGGIQKMISGSVGAGFVLYVATKIVGDLGGVGGVESGGRGVVAGDRRKSDRSVRAAAAGGWLMDPSIAQSAGGGKRRAALARFVALALLCAAGAGCAHSFRRRRRAPKRSRPRRRPSRLRQRRAPLSAIPTSSTLKPTRSSMTETTTR